MVDLTNEIRAYALRNAIEFGSADAGRVLPKLFAHGLDKKDIKQLMPIIQKIVREVNALSVPERAEEFAKFKGIVKEHEEKEKKLPELENTEHGVVTRLPPEPSKYLHLGHALSFLINSVYADKYNGKCLLRFEDANPEKVAQEYVDSILEDLTEYLQIKIDGVRYVSDDMQQLYAYADQLVQLGSAYVCFCDREKMQEFRHEGTECECRKQSKKEAANEWEKLKSGSYNEGEAVLRFKGDMKHTNHIMRDSALFRVVKKPHFRQGKKYSVWPLFDFYNPIEDHLMGVTHILRSNEFDVRVELHEALRNKLGLSNQTTVQYGRFTVIGAETKGRDIRARIEAGEYTGWDDPRLVTLKTLRRRGITLEVLRELVQHLGLTKKQANIDFDMIAAISRKLLDTTSARYYFVAEPKKLTISGMPKTLKEVDIKLHPDKEDVRKVAVGKNVFIAQTDYEQFKGKEVRLMSLCNVQLDSKPRCTGIENKRIQKIHWVSEETVKVKVRMDTGTWTTGLGEAELKKLNVGDIVQFERFGFVRLDKKGKNELEFWFAHH